MEYAAQPRTRTCARPAPTRPTNQGSRVPRPYASSGVPGELARWGGTRTGGEVRTPTLALHAMAVEFPEVHGHPNRLPFEGVLTLVDVPSDKAPSGARGHRVILTREAAEAALPSLLGMAVDYKSGWDGHDARQKCGIITHASLDGRRLTVAGFLFAKDFPEVEQRLSLEQPRMHCHPERSEGSPHFGFSEGQMGMSYELADAHVADMRAPIWTLTRATFTGAAILLRDKAAYRDTTFRLRRTPHRVPQSSAARSSSGL